MSQAATPHSHPVTAARVCSIVAFVLAAIAVLFFPIIFGPGAIILGVIGYTTGDRVLGKWAIVAGVAGTILGFLLAYLVLT
jgi:hypothetical protein